MPEFLPEGILFRNQELANNIQAPCHNCRLTRKFHQMSVKKQIY